MKAVEAIYEKGEITFPFEVPETHGPVSILVIFPDDPVDFLEWDLEGDLENSLEVPM